MIKKLFLILCAMCIPALAQEWNGILDPTRAMDWTSAGAIIDLDRPQCVTTQCNAVTSAGASATATQINAAIASACNSGTYVLIPSGTITNSAFWFLAPTGLTPCSNITIRGHGPQPGGTETHWTSGGGVVPYAIYVANADTNYSGNVSNLSPWTAGYVQGTSIFTLTAATTGSLSKIHQGTLGILTQNDDATDTGNYFVAQSTGSNGTFTQEGGSAIGIPGASPCNTPATCFSHQQQVTIISCTGANSLPCDSGGTAPATVVVTPGLDAPNWNNGKTHSMWWSNGLPISGVGIEDMKIDVSAATDITNAVIYFQNATNSWVKNVYVVNSTASTATHKHVQTYQSSHITVRDSYFYGSRGSSESYGVDFSFGSADTLAENNIFQHIATGMIAEGATGFVFGYNYSVDNYYTGSPIGSDTAWQQCDAYHHGPDDHGLWEGNIGICFILDNDHNTGNMNTAFRNLWTGFDPGGGGVKTENTSAIDWEAYNRYTNFLFNVVGTTGKHTIYESAAASPTAAGNSANSNASVFTIGFSGNQGTRHTSGFTIDNDTFTKTSSLRYGNIDVVTGTNIPRFCGNSSNTGWSTTCASTSEVPTGLSIYANSVPTKGDTVAAQSAMAASFYHGPRPLWWPTSIPWPAIGPDVTGGNITGYSGHAYKNPAAKCYLDTMSGATDGSSGPLPYTCTTSFNMVLYPNGQVTPSTEINLFGGPLNPNGIDYTQFVNILSNPANLQYFTGVEPTLSLGCSQNCTGNSATYLDHINSGGGLGGGDCPNFQWTGTNSIVALMTTVAGFGFNNSLILSHAGYVNNNSTEPFAWSQTWADNLDTDCATMDSSLFRIDNHAYLPSDYICFGGTAPSCSGGRYWQMGKKTCTNADAHDNRCVTQVGTPGCFAGLSSPCADGSGSNQAQWTLLPLVGGVPHAPLLDAYCNASTTGNSQVNCFMLLISGAASITSHTAQITVTNPPTWQNGAPVSVQGSTSSGTVTTSGSSFTWVSGAKFSTTWTGPIVIKGTTYTIASITSATTGTTTATIGTNTNAVSYSFANSVYNCSTATVTASTATTVSYTCSVALGGNTNDTLSSGNITGAHSLNLNSPNMPAGAAGLSLLANQLPIPYEQQMRVLTKYMFKKTADQFPLASATPLAYVRVGPTKNGEADTSFGSSTLTPWWSNSEYNSYENELYTYMGANGCDTIFACLANVNSTNPNTEALYAITNNIGIGNNALGTNHAYTLNCYSSPSSAAACGVAYNGGVPADGALFHGGNWAPLFKTYHAPMPNSLSGHWPVLETQTTQEGTPGSSPGTCAISVTCTLGSCSGPAVTGSMAQDPTCTNTTFPAPNGYPGNWNLDLQYLGNDMETYPCDLYLALSILYPGNCNPAYSQLTYTLPYKLEMLSFLGATTTAPVFTSANSVNFIVGVNAPFIVTTTGSPSPVLSETGALPTGCTFSDNGNGTATLACTPIASGATSLVWNAVNLAGSTTQNFTLNVINQTTIGQRSGSGQFVVNSGVFSGPPAYILSTQSQANVTGTCDATGANPGTGTGLCLPVSYALGNFAVNTTFHDTSLNPNSNCAVVIWDARSANNQSDGNTSVSGGANDEAGSLLGDLVIIAQGGAASLINITRSGGCPQVANTGAYSAVASPAIVLGAVPAGGEPTGPFAFSSVSDPTFYHVASAACAGSGCSTNVPDASNSQYSVIYKAVVTATPPLSNPVPYTSAYLFDFRNCPGLGAAPGALTGHSASILSRNHGDTRFSIDESFIAGGQGTARYSMVYDTTLGCKTFDISTGYIYKWCSVFPCDSTQGPGNVYYMGQETTCYGPSDTTHSIHDGQMGRLGDNLFITIAASAGHTYTHGVCAGVVNPTMLVLWHIDDNTTVLNNNNVGGSALNTVQYIDGSVTFGSAGGHNSAGCSHILNYNSPNPNTRLWTTPLSFTQFANDTTGSHSHLVDDATCSDTGAWVNGTQGALNAGNTGFGFDNPPAFVHENEAFAFLNWSTNVFGTNGNPPQPRFIHNYDATAVLATSTQVSSTTTTATYTAANAFPVCASSTTGTLNTVGTAVTNITGTTATPSWVGQTLTIAGTPFTVSAYVSPTAVTLSTSAGTQTGVAFVGPGPCGTFTASIAGCTNSQFNQASINLASITPTSVTTTGTYLVQAPVADSCKITVPSNFGCNNAILYTDQAGKGLVTGANFFGQLGADANGSAFCSAIYSDMQ